MASNINIGYARVALASIMHTVENGRRFESHGSMLSMRSPQRAAIINEIDPKVAGEKNRLSYTVDGNGYPVAKVTMQWRPQLPAGTLSNARQGKAAIISNAGTESGVLTDDVIYNNHNEYSEKFTTAQLLKLEPSAATYLNAVNKGLTLSGLSGVDYEGLAEIGERVIERIDRAIFAPVNVYAQSNLIANIGKNIADGTTAANIPVVALFDNAGRPMKNLVDKLNQMARAHELQADTRLIIVGGYLFSKYMDALEMSSVQDLGYDAQKMKAKMKFEWYYDSSIDLNYGPGKIIVSDPGAAALGFLAEHGDVIKQTQVGNTTYTRAKMVLTGFDSAPATMDMDLRVIVSDDGPYPEVFVAPSVRSAIFTRPPGAIKTYGGFEDQTGIWGIQLVEFAAEL